MISIIPLYNDSFQGGFDLCKLGQFHASTALLGDGCPRRRDGPTSCQGCLKLNALHYGRGWNRARFPATIPAFGLKLLPNMWTHWSDIFCHVLSPMKLEVIKNIIPVCWRAWYTLLHKPTLGMVTNWLPDKHPLIHTFCSPLDIICWGWLSIERSNIQWIMEDAHSWFIHDGTRTLWYHSTSSYIHYVTLKYTGWWFQAFFIFRNIWDNPSHWLFFKMVETTNQYIVIETPNVHGSWSSSLAHTLSKGSLASTAQSAAGGSKLEYFYVTRIGIQWDNMNGERTM